jgi:hypothetical protein
MHMATKKTKGGGALSRSVGVSIRLDPKLRYLAELGARSHRRTLSSYIEWAVQQSLSNVVLRSDGREVRLADVADGLWDVDEADRFVKLATHAYDLLIHEEQVLWKLICENGAVWLGNYEENDPTKFDEGATFQWKAIPKYLNIKKLRLHFATFKSVAAGELSPDALPKWRNYQQEGTFGFEEPNPASEPIPVIEPKPK